VSQLLSRQRPGLIGMDVEPTARTPSRSKAPGFPPPPSVSLNRVHVSDSLKRSPDHGATLDFARQNLNDIGESAIEELATIGREELEDESSVLRCVPEGL
jgi:hypothetical protein